jgi:FkbM family methyltransferase
MKHTTIKNIFSSLFWPVGSVRSIFWGPGRGLKYRIYGGYGLAPLYGGWEPDVQSIMVKYIRPDFVVYDVGANYGIHTLLLARLVQNSGCVFAFEPILHIFEALEENIGLNSFSNVICKQVAVGEKTGSETFIIGKHDGAGHLASAGKNVLNAEGVLLEAVSIDDFVYRYGNHPPNFIKVDVEGAESFVLSGAKKVLQEHRPLLLVELHNPEQDVAVGQILMQQNYLAYRIGEDKPVLELLTGWPDPNGLWGTFIAFPTELEILK